MTAPTEFDSLVDSIIRTTRVSRDKAIAAAALNRPDLVPAFQAQVERDARVLEKAEQAEVSKLAGGFGFTVRSNSQYRPAKVSPGIPDLILIHRARGIGLFWETKRQVGGSQSTSQQEFESDCRLVGWTYRMGDRYDFVRYLLNLGLAEEGAGPYGVVPVVNP